MTRASAAAIPSGLAVQRHPTADHGYVVIHLASGRDAGPWLRLRRQAEAAAAELGQTGVDWTLPADDLHATPEFRTGGPVGVVVTKWKERAHRCCEGTEHYSPHTYAMNGHCMGPMSNGLPRRSLQRGGAACMDSTSTR